MVKTMRLAVDARILAAPNAGSAYYTRGWLQAVGKAGFDGEIILIGPAGTATDVAIDGATVGVMVQDVGLGDAQWEQLRLPALLERLGPDVFVSPTGTVPMLKCCPQVNVVYDLGFEVHPEFYQAGLRSYLRRWVPRSCQSADVVVTLSRFSERELKRLYGVEGERIVICPGAASDRFGPIEEDTAVHDIHTRYGIEPPYVLSVCSLERNKNLPRLVRAFSRAQKRLDRPWSLVLAGRAGGARRQLGRLLAQLEVANQVVLTGFVPDAELEVLYAGADLFALVSVYEGFGLPVLEAMASETAVLCSQRASLPEVVGDAGVVVDPYEVEAIENALVQLLSDADKRAYFAEAGLRRAARFDWSDTAGKLIHTCKELACVC